MTMKIVSDTNGEGEQDPMVETQINLPFDLWATLDAAIKDDDKRRAEQRHTAKTPIEVSDAMAIAVATILEGYDVFAAKHCVEELCVLLSQPNLALRQASSSL